MKSGGKKDFRTERVGGYDRKRTHTYKGGGLAKK